MSANHAWSKSYPSNAESAIELVRRCVAAARSWGTKTDVALHDLAPALGTTPRRIRTLFHRDREPVVLKNEWLSLRYRAGLFFLNNAVRLRELADEHEEIGNNLVSGQQEFKWEERTNATQRHAA